MAVEAESIEKLGRQKVLKKAIFGLNSRYLGDGQTRDGLSWSTWQFKRGTLLSHQQFQSTLGRMCHSFLM